MRSHLVRTCLSGFGGLIFAWSLCLGAQTPACSRPLPERQRQALTTYVRNKYKLPDTIALSLKKDTSVGDTCYRELTFEGKSPLKTWELTLYASSDARFLSSDLFDTTIDPALEERAKDEAVMKGLVQGASATRGPADAAVTIVEFSDFECPFCRNFAQILNEALSRGPDDVRVVFHHLPLSMHPWARMAAEAAGCAQLQSNQAFWSVHDQIFQNQKTITAENAKDKLANLAAHSKGVDAAAFRKCIDSGMSVGLVLKDMNAAQSNQIEGTPTIFINGHRIQGVGNASKLLEMIAEARKETISLRRARQGGSR